MARKEAHQVPALAAWVAHREVTREAIVIEALRPEGANELTARMIIALTDFRVWQSLIDQNVSNEEAVDMLNGLFHLTAEPPKVTTAD